MIWPQTFEERLPDWHELRQRAGTFAIGECADVINDWWWRAPIVSKGLSWNNIDSWPNPWQLLAQNGFCDVARSLGMLYTIMMTNNREIKSLDIIQTKTHNLVSINREKYILNWSPGITVNIPSSEVHITRRISSNRFERLTG